VVGFQTWLCRRTLRRIATSCRTRRHSRGLDESYSMSAGTRPLPPSADRASDQPLLCTSAQATRPQLPASGPSQVVCRRPLSGRSRNLSRRVRGQGGNPRADARPRLCHRRIAATTSPSRYSNGAIRPGCRHTLVRRESPVRRTNAQTGVRTVAPFQRGVTTEDSSGGPA
jgi:hypothetical protein